jgi:hypothetical protein
MQGWHDAAQLILQILSNPAWSGVSSLCSLMSISLAILLYRQSKTPFPQIAIQNPKKYKNETR